MIAAVSAGRERRIPDHDIHFRPRAVFSALRDQRVCPHDAVEFVEDWPAREP
jgi:hypothetical protein